MVNDIKFKIRGIKKLLTFDELMKVPSKGKINRVQVIDLKTQQNYTTGMVTIMRKFK